MAIIPPIVIGVVPSVNVKFQGAVPVKATLKLVLDPEQIDVVPESTAVGKEFTEIIAVPEKIPAQFASFTPVSE